MTVNYTEESTTMKGEELAEHFEDINNDIKQIDIRALKESTGKKILRAMERLKKLISECTKLLSLKLFLTFWKASKVGAIKSEELYI